MIFRFAGHARKMSYRHLTITAAILKKDQCRKEPVHAFEHRNTLGHIRPEHLERASRIRRPIMGHHLAEAVREFRLESLEESILSVRTNSDHHAVFVNAFEEEIKIVRSGLEIRIHVADIVRASIIETCLDSSTQSCVLYKTYIIEIFISCTNFLDSRQTAV